MALDTMRKWLEDKSEEIGDALDEYNATPSPSAGALRPFFGLSSAGAKASSPEMDAFLARMEAVRDRRDMEAALKLPPVKALEDMPPEGVRRTLDEEQRLPPFFRRDTPLESLRRPAEVAPRPVARAEAVAPPPKFTPDTTKMRGKLASLLGGGSLVSPIPVANAPSGLDAPATVASTLPATTDKQPAGKPDSADAPNLPAPLSEGAGGDASERDLYLARLAAQSAAGFGGMGAGKNIDMGIADTLGERLKQVQALRAKREDQSLEQQRERATWGTSNRSTLASALAQWKGDEAKTAALEALASGADTTKPSDFSRNAVNAVMTRPKVEGLEAKTNTEKGKPEIAEGTLGVKRGTLVERERSNRANEEIRRRAFLVKKASDTKANNDVRAAGSDSKAAEKAITRAMETAEADKLGIVGNIRDFEGLETVAPGFTRGIVPSWLGQGGIEAARKVPALNRQATQLSSALETFIAGIRKSLFGASLTGNEKASFDAIVNSGLFMPPDVLAANINRLRLGAAKFAQNHFTVAQELYPEVTNRILKASTLFGPAVAEGGVYSDVWKLPAGASPVSGAGPAVRPPKPADKPGAKTLWNKKRSTWVQYDPNAEAKARAANAVED